VRRKYKAFIDYQLQLATARQKYVAYRRTNFTDATNAFQSAHEQAKTNADAQLKSLLQLQDDYHNEEVETSTWRNKQLLSASYTSFGPGLGQPTTMYPAQQLSLTPVTPASSFTPAVLSGASISRDARYSSIPEVSLTFNKGALVQVLSRTGPVTSYVWGYNNTLPVAKVTGVRYTALSKAYQTAGENAELMRKDAAFAHALLTTYAYQPLVGMISQTEVTGRLTSFEYDALGRLVCTRDEQGRILSQQQYHYAGK
jgi:YD repeat-containing protein